MFIDANVFIIASLGRDVRAERCQDFIRKIESGEQHAITSVLVLDEVLRAITLRYDNKEKSEAIVRKIAATQNLTVCDITLAHLLDSLSYVRSDTLDPHDALHAAIMKAQGVSTILSYDKDFERLKSVKRMEP